jgi:hypothetical protein
VAAQRTKNGSGSAGKRRAKWIDKHEYERRMAAGDCFRCGGSDHSIKYCDYLPAKRPAAKVAVVTTETTKGKEPATESLSEDSENE